MKTLLAISSAPNRDSNSTTLLEEFCRGAETAGVHVERVHLYDLHLPYFDYENRKAEPADNVANRDIKKMEEFLINSHGLVIAAPVWNFSVPAILKNFLDRISYIGRVFKHKKSMHKQPNLTQLHCYYIFTFGVPWYGWLFDSLAYYHTTLTLWYCGGKNHGLLKASDCGNGSTNVVKNRPKLLHKAYKKGRWFAQKYLQENSL
ncbi:NAD(P)H-dependent oxidoreductase [Candidatus Peregrinibacteria bacterium]|nr:NAD(P)H-dependent oxidoreductase [Candidatus Peregrinibacteria bacterium]